MKQKIDKLDELQNVEYELGDSKAQKPAELGQTKKLWESYRNYKSAQQDDSSSAEDVIVKGDIMDVASIFEKARQRQKKNMQQFQKKKQKVPQRFGKSKKIHDIMKKNSSLTKKRLY